MSSQYQSMSGETMSAAQLRCEARRTHQVRMRRRRALEKQDAIEALLSRVNFVVMRDCALLSHGDSESTSAEMHEDRKSIFTGGEDEHAEPMEDASQSAAKQHAKKVSSRAEEDEDPSYRERNHGQQTQNAVGATNPYAVPSLPDLATSSSAFSWTTIPSILTPDSSVLDASIADTAALAQEAQRQKRYEKKLQRKVDDGEINVQEMQDLLKKHGRAQERASGSASFSYMTANRGRRKREQIENFVVMLEAHQKRWEKEQEFSSSTACVAKKQHQLEASGLSTSSTAPDSPAVLRARRDTGAPCTTLTEDIGRKIVVVDFGCGSGNLCLPLAHHFRETHHFVFVDRNATSLDLVKKRAQTASLTNVEVLQYEFTPADCVAAPGAETFDFLPGRTFDLGIGLHCCGSFTDMVMDLCKMRSASCIVCPCCNGKVRRENAPSEAWEQTTGVGLEDDHSSMASWRKDFVYPRSPHLSRYIDRDAYLNVVCPAADNNDHDDGAYTSSFRGAKCLIELDRALYAKHWYEEVQVAQLVPASCTPKNIVICCWRQKATMGGNTLDV